MGADSTFNIRRLRSRPSSPGFSPDKIDAEAGVIRDVVMVEEGPAKGHGVHLDADFITAIAAYDQATFDNIGLKARLGHPGASDNTMGTQLGRFHNFRVRRSRGKMQEIADLHLLAAADESPTKPGMRAWVLRMAQEDPEFIMSSIVFRGSGYYQRKANGHKKSVMSEMDIDPDMGEVFVEFDAEAGAEHYYTDLVEAGAATDSLFSHDANPHLFLVQAENFLHDHPHLLEFIQTNPDKVRDFLSRYAAAPGQPDTEMSEAINQPVTLSAETLAEQIAAARADGAEQAGLAFQNRVENLETAMSAIQTNLAALQSELAAARTELAALTARVAALEAQPAAQHTAGATDTVGSDTELADKPYLKNPIYLRAKAMSGSRAADTN